MEKNVVQPLVFCLLLCCVALVGGEPAEGESPEREIVMPSSSAAALERVQTEAEELKSRRGPEPATTATQGSAVRTARNLVEGNVLSRNGVAYYEEWTIRAGVARLRLPARPGWGSVNANTPFFEQLANGGSPGEHLTTVLVNRDFVAASRSKYVNYFMQVWVPQEYAFKLMTLGSFAAFKSNLQAEAVAQREKLVRREEFATFEDYLNFKFGRDEAVESFVDGFMVRAVDEPDLVIYFAASEFRFGGGSVDWVDPMILTVCYALVNEKLIRIDTKRMYGSEEDIPVLLAETKAFVLAMRQLNDLQESRPRR